MNSEATIAPPKRKGEIDLALGVAGDRLDHVEHVLGQLEDGLNPILTPEQPTEDADNRKEQDDRTPPSIIAATLEAYCRRLVRIADRIQILSDRNQL